MKRFIIYLAIAAFVTMVIAIVVSMNPKQFAGNNAIKDIIVTPPDEQFNLDNNL